MYILNGNPLKVYRLYSINLCQGPQTGGWECGINIRPNEDKL